MIMLEIFLGFFKKYWLVICCALIVGIISVFPWIQAINSLGGAYQGVFFSNSGDDYTYLARMQEVLDGHPMVGSAFYYEYKDMASLMLPFGEYLYVALSFVFRLSIVNTLFASKFIFPIVLFFLTYCLAVLLAEEKNSLRAKINAIATGFFVTLGYDLIDYKFVWHYVTSSLPDPKLMLWTRPVNPIVGALCLFIYLLCLWLIISKRHRLLIVPAGILAGLMIFYFFSWGIALAITAVLALIFLLIKRYEILKDLLWVALIDISIVLAFLYKVIFSFASPDGQGLALRNGMFLTHAPIFNKVVLAGLLFFTPFIAFEYYQKRKKGEAIADWWWFCWALLLGGLLAFNQQIITGRTIWPAHFVQYTIPLTVIACLILSFNKIRIMSGSLWAVAIGIVIIASLSFSIFEVSRRNNYLPAWRETQNYAAPLAWLNNNAPKDCVVLTADYRALFLVTAFTHCNAYVSYWNYAGVPFDRTVFNYLVYLKMKGITPENVEAYLQENISDVRLLYFADWGQLYDRNDNAGWLQDKKNLVASQYREFYGRNFKKELNRYRLDYILSAGPLSKEIAGQLAGVKPVFEANNLFMYSF